MPGVYFSQDLRNWDKRNFLCFFLAFEFEEFQLQKKAFLVDFNKRWKMGVVYLQYCRSISVLYNTVEYSIVHSKLFYLAMLHSTADNSDNTVLLDKRH